MLLCRMNNYDDMLDTARILSYARTVQTVVHSKTVLHTHTTYLAVVVEVWVESDTPMSCGPHVDQHR